MSVVDEVQKLLPWAQGLPLFAKITLTLIVLFAAFLFISLVWVTPAKPNITTDPQVVTAYNRMVKVLNRLQENEHGIFVDGRLIPKIQEDSWQPYLVIQAAVHANPGDINAAYEAVMENGGESRVFTDSTQSFETVVSNFAREVDRIQQPSSLTTK